MCTIHFFFGKTFIFGYTYYLDRKEHQNLLQVSQALTWILRQMVGVQNRKTIKLHTYKVCAQRKTIYIDNRIIIYGDRFRNDVKIFIFHFM